ncbi:MAG: cadherin-like domain-containing protein [Planctomycetota bacterium]|nr:cadherin-like domain-containing protein [Planctomycetota bacterium]
MECFSERILGSSELFTSRVVQNGRLNFPPEHLHPRQSMVQRRGRTKHRAISRRPLLIEQLGERRVFAAITGEVFNDINHSLHRDQTESGVGNRLIFIDANQNQRLEQGEPISLSNTDGLFQFQGVELGQHAVRLFRGSEQQLQTFPVVAQQELLSVNSIDASSIGITHGQWHTLSPSNAVLESGGLDAEQSFSTQLEGVPTQLHPLPDGQLLLLGSEDQEAASWIVNPATGSVIRQSEALDQSYDHWSSSTLRADGRGLAVANSGDSSSLYRMQYAEDSGLIFTPTAASITQGAIVMTSGGSRDLIAQPVDDAFNVHLWSDSEGLPIEGSAARLEGVNQFLAFDDASGILLTRDDQQHLSLFDVDANFALLHRFEDVAGPVAFDAQHGRLATLDFDQSLLELRETIHGSIFSEIEIDLTKVGTPRDIEWVNSNTLILLGTQGLVTISLTQSTSATVDLGDVEETVGVVFGVQSNPQNRVPTVPETLRWSLNEDSVLALSASQVMAEVVDPDDDQLVVIQESEPANGSISIHYDGTLVYQPNTDFFGTDSVIIRIHDGQAISESISLEFIVQPIPDPPTAVQASLVDLPSSLSAGALVGRVRVIDPDNINRRLDGAKHQVVVDDQRFEVVGDHLFFVGDSIDFSAEPSIHLTFTAFDPESNSSVESKSVVSVIDPNGPQLSIAPDSLRVEENLGETLLTLLEIHDPDYVGDHEFEVDDDRFYIQGDQLFLQENAHLDFETEPEIALVITATRSGGPHASVKELLLIEVLDVPEQPQSILLTNQTVLENTYGAVVGQVLVDGGRASSQFLVSVNDSRFEVANGILKLRDQVLVERNSQTEIEVMLMVSDQSGIFESISSAFVLHVAENANPYHNADNPYDVDRNGSVTALDALAIINYLNVYGPGPIQRTDGDYAYDVNANKLVTSLDVLLVLNELNRQRLRGEAVSDGEQVDVEADVDPDETPLPYPTNSTHSMEDVDSPLPAGFRNTEMNLLNSEWTGEMVDETIPLIELDPWLGSEETEKVTEEETGEQDLSGNIDLLSEEKSTPDG